MGLDTDLFNTCLDSGKHANFVEGQSAQASQLGVQSTPSFLINGRPLVGAQPFEMFERYIQTELDE